MEHQKKPSGTTPNTNFLGLRFLIDKSKLIREPEVMDDASRIRKIAEDTFMFPIEEIKVQLKKTAAKIKIKENRILGDFTVDIGDESFHARWSTKKSNYECATPHPIPQTRSSAAKLTAPFRKGGISPLKFVDRSKGVDVKFPVVIDPTGNAAVMKLLKDSGLEIAPNSATNVEDYSIVHLWGNAFHPLYFAFKWNILVMPEKYSSLTDKNREGLPKTLKNSLKKYIWDRCGKEITELFDACNVELPPHDFGTDYVDIDKILAFDEVFKK